MSNCSGYVTQHLLVIHGLKDVILSWAIEMASTGLDEHHVFLHDSSVGTFELHGERGGPVGGAAAAVRTHSTELWPKGFGGGAARDLKLHWFGNSGGADTFFPFLDALFQMGLAGSDHAQTRLLFQTTLPVVIGDPCGDSKATSLRAGTPFCGLNQAVVSHQRGVWSKSVLLSVGRQS